MNKMTWPQKLLVFFLALLASAMLVAFASCNYFAPARTPNATEPTTVTTVPVQETEPTTETTAFVPSPHI